MRAKKSLVLPHHQIHQSVTQHHTCYITHTHTNTKNSSESSRYSSVPLLVYVRVCVSVREPKLKVTLAPAAAPAEHQRHCEGSRHEYIELPACTCFSLSLCVPVNAPCNCVHQQRQQCPSLSSRDRHRQAHPVTQAQARLHTFFSLSILFLSAQTHRRTSMRL